MLMSDTRNSSETRAQESYWVRATVRLESPLRTRDGEVVREYGLNLGVACKPEEVTDVVMAAIVDGNVVWSDTEWYPVERDAITDPSIRKQINFGVERGVWYRSGRILVAE